ncbi:hypothetical protein SBY92_002050 [Candida maltosa Xu316]
MTLLVLLFISLTAPWIWSYSTRVQPTVIPVSIAFEKESESFNFPDLIQATQFQINAELPYATNKTITVQLQDNLTGTTHTSTTKYAVDLVLSRDNSLGLSPDGSKAYVLYSYDAILSNDLPYLITQTILYHLLKAEL